MADSTEIFDPQDLDGIAAPGNAPASAPNNAPASHPWHPGFTRKQAADALGCSDSLIRKRLKQLEAFHSQHALIAADGSLAEAGFIAIERLGRLGIAEYRQQYSQRIAARQLPADGGSSPTAGAIEPYRAATIVPLVESPGTGAMAIARDLDTAAEMLMHRRAQIAARRDELQRRAAERNRNLSDLFEAANALRDEENALSQLESVEAARDAAADMVRSSLGNAIAPNAGACGG